MLSDVIIVTEAAEEYADAWFENVIEPQTRLGIPE